MPYYYMRKPAFCICENKDADQLRRYISCAVISTFVFAIWIVKSLYYLNPKLQASSYLLWLYSLVCDGPGLKPRRPVFSQRGSYSFILVCTVGSNTQSNKSLHFCLIMQTCPNIMQRFFKAATIIRASL